MRSKETGYSLRLTRRELADLFGMIMLLVVGIVLGYAINEFMQPHRLPFEQPIREIIRVFV